MENQTENISVNPIAYNTPDMFGDVFTPGCFGDAVKSHEETKRMVLDPIDDYSINDSILNDIVFNADRIYRMYGVPEYTYRTSRKRDPEVVYDEDGHPVISKEKLYTKEYNKIRKEQRDADLFKVLAIKMGQSKYNSSIVTVIRSKYKIIHRQSQGAHAVANLRAQKIFAKLNNNEYSYGTY